MQPLTLAVAAIALVGFVLISLLNHRRSKATQAVKELPGPTLLPVIGRIHDLPIDYMWLKFKEWADIYGPIYKTEMLGTKFIIVSDEKIAEELLVKRAKIYSDRPAAQSLFQPKVDYLPLMGKNHYWARQRRVTHDYMTGAHNAHYYGIMDLEVRRWMFRLLEKPQEFQWSLEDMAGKVMSTLTWDAPDQSEKLVPSAWGLLTQMSPAGPLTNVMTPLWHLPLFMNPWKKAEIKRYATQNAWWMERFVTVRAQMTQGQARHSWTSQYLESEKTSKLSGDKEASFMLGMMALVGVFTVAGPLNYFLLAMVYHPQWQRKLQQEIDEVCKGRIPTLDDMPNLPLLRACIKETMRWKPNVPTGVAHELEEDDFYHGCFIAKGTRVLPFDLAFLRNPAKYPDPESYRPERWLESGWPTYQEPLSVYPTIKGMSSFGWGQRTCLGQNLTNDELFVACGALAWAYDLKKKVDPVTGLDIEVDLNKSGSLLIIKPDPFVMEFTPRSEKRRQDIIDEYREYQAKDDDAREAFAKTGAAKHAETALPN